MIGNAGTPYSGGIVPNITIIADNGGKTVTKDITPLVLEFNIHQSIFENSMTCDISLVDASGTIFEEMQMTGQEIAQISLTGNGGGKTFAFRIYKIDKPQPLQERAYALTLYGVSPAFEKSINTAIFNYYTNLTGDQIVAEVMSEHITGDAKLTAEPSENVLTYTAAGHSPFEFINMVARDTQSSQYPDSSSYLFFENADGYNFVTVNSLLDKSPVAEFHFADPGTSRSGGKNYIAGITWHHTTDALKGLQNGLYDNTVAAIDVITKTYREYTFNYSQENDKLTHIRNSGRPLVKPKAFGGLYMGDALTGQSHVRFIETDFNLEIENQSIDGRISETIDPHKFHARTTHNYLPAQVAQMASLQQHRMDITATFVPSVTAGDLINIYLPNNIGSDSRYAPYFSMYGQRNPTFLVLENIITFEAQNGNIYSTLKTAKESLGEKLVGPGPAGLLENLLSSLFAQDKNKTPNASGESRAENQTQTYEEAGESVEGQLLTDEDGNKGLPYSTLTPLEKQYALEKEYADADTYPDDTFQ
jgi:hypothetical protein